MRNKNLTDDEKFNLRLVLTAFCVPDDVIESVLSSGKAQLLNKYFLRNEDFILETKQGIYRLLFSTVKVSSGFEALKLVNNNLSGLKTDLPDNDSSNKPIDSLSTTELNLPIKKGRGRGKKPALSRTSLTCLVDSSDFQNLEHLASTKDVSVSHLVRLAIKLYLKNGVKNEYNL